MNINKYLKKQIVAFVVVVISALIAIEVQANGDHLVQSYGECFSTEWPHEKSSLKSDPAIIYGRLANGFRYVLMPNNEPKDRVALYLDVQAGSLNENAKERGYAHFLEHMVFNGSTHFKPGELIAYFQDLGMDFGGDTNAHTGLDETVYKIILPKSDLGEIKKGFQVMMDYSRGALLLETEIDREKKVILAEKLARDSVSYRTRVVTRQNALKGTLIAEREPIGTVETLKAADSRTLRAFYEKWYRPEKIILVAVGDFEKKSVEKLLVETFETLKGAGEYPQCPEIGSPQLKGVESFYHFEKDQGSVHVSIESYWEQEAENDSIDVQLRLLRDYFANRVLEKRLKILSEQDHALFAQSHVSSGRLAKSIKYSMVSVSTSDKNWQQSLEILEKNLRQMLSFGITEEELQLVKDEFTSYYDSSVLTAKTRRSSSLAQQIIHDLNNNRVFQSPQQLKKIYLPLVKKISLNEINSSFNKLWSQGNRLIEVTGNVEIQSDNVSQFIKDIYLKSQKVKVAQPQILKKRNFPYIVASKNPSPPVSSDFIESIETEIIRYENGNTLNLKKTDFAENEVEILLNFGPGKQSEPVPGLAMLAESVIGASGTGRFTNSEFERVLAGSSVGYDFEINKTSFTIKGSATKNETELLVQTLFTLFLDPAIREVVVENMMKRYERMYLKIENDIQGTDSLYVERFFAGGNSLFGIPAWQDFSKLSLTQIRQWIIPYFHKAPLEISVVGDFDKKKVIGLINKYSSSLEKGSRNAVSHQPITFPKGENLEIKIQSKIEKALVTFAWQTNDYSDISRTRRFYMLASILDERIRLAIREQLGASYSPTVYNSSSRIIPGFGLMKVQLVVSPDNIKKVKKAVLEVVENLQQNGIMEEELERAKRPILTSLKDRVRNNRYWLYSVLSMSSVYQEQLKWPDTLLSDNSSITATEMTEYAQKYLKNDGVAVAVVQPGDKVSLH